MSTLTEPHTNGHDRELDGVRTYRGRKLEEPDPADPRPSSAPTRSSCASARA